MKLFDSWLFRLLGILLCLWLWTHLKPTPMITLTTPTQTVIKQFAGLPPLPGLSEPTR